VLLLLLISPTNAKFKYKVEKGVIWLYDDLAADFDYAIKKSDAELANERTQFENEFAPYYELDADVVKGKKQDFERAFTKQLVDNVNEHTQYQELSRNAKNYVAYGNRLLEKFYNRGIIKDDTLFKRKDKDFVINILVGNTVERRPIQNVFTVEKIKKMLYDSLPNSGLRDPEFLFPLLDNAFVPNLTFNAELTKKYKQQQLDSFPVARGMVHKGEVIVRNSTMIDEPTYQRILSYKEVYESDSVSSRKF
jgi:cyclic-di-AMP phosphodiesterase PgpH